MSEGRLAYQAVEVITSNPTGSRIAYQAVELITSPGRHELRAETVPFAEDLLVGST